MPSLTRASMVLPRHAHCHRRHSSRNHYRTSANTSQVRLLTDPDTNIPATTLNQASGNLIFTHNTLQLTQVTQNNSSTQKNLSSLLAQKQFPGLLIGTIKQITSNDSDVYQTATITPAATITQHQHLFVIIN